MEFFGIHYERFKKTFIDPVNGTSSLHLPLNILNRVKEGKTSLHSNGSETNPHLII